MYPEYYELYIDGSLHENTTYGSGPICHNLDVLADSLGPHLIEINAYALDGDYARYSTNITVYSSSNLLMEVNALEDIIFLSNGNLLNVSFSTEYPDFYEIFIAEELVQNGSYSTNPILYDLDYLARSLSIYPVEIYAYALDGDNVSYTKNISVYSSSTLELQVNALENIKFLSSNNALNFSLLTEYPEYYELFIDGFLKRNESYTSEPITHCLDYLSDDLGIHSIEIYGYALDGDIVHYATNISTYSDSALTLEMYMLNNIKFLSVGNLMNFSLSSEYPEGFMIYIDGILVQNGTFSTENIICDLDTLSPKLGTHLIEIYASALDGDTLSYATNISTYSDSVLGIEVNHLENIKFLSVNNTLNFTLNTDYPEYYELYIDNTLKQNDTYTSEPILYNLDYLSGKLGMYNVEIYGYALDGDELYYSQNISVYSNSQLRIQINSVNDIKFLSTNNTLNASLLTEYPDYYELFIDGVLKLNDTFGSDEICYNLDVLADSLGPHLIEINAYALDGDYARYSTNITVYSSSNLLMEVNALEDIIFLSNGNLLNVSFSTEYPDFYEIFIAEELVQNGSYSTNPILYDLDYLARSLSIYPVEIYAYALDGDNVSYTKNISVYSTSTLELQVNNLENIEFLSSDNTLNFSLLSEYPDYYVLYIDGVLKQNESFTDEPISYCLDYLSDQLGIHSVEVFGYALDGDIIHYATNISTYSNSTLTIEVNSLENIEFQSTENSFNFTLKTKYPETYTVYIDGILVQNDTFSTENIICDLDTLSAKLGTHMIEIYGYALDGDTLTYTTNISTYSNSVLGVEIHQLDNIKFLSSNNTLNFSLKTDYPDYYELYLDGSLERNTTYIGEELLVNLDTLANILGLHTIEIYAWALDGDFIHYSTEIETYSNSTLSIQVNRLENVKYLTMGNTVNFTLITDYPDYYEFYLDGSLKANNSYGADGILCNLDSASDIFGMHTIEIYAWALDGDFIHYSTEFETYSNSTLSIDVRHLENIKFLSSGNTVNFTINTDYPDHYTLTVNGEEIYNGPFGTSEISHSLDPYTSELGTHHIIIEACALDGDNAAYTASFLTYSDSVLSLGVDANPTYAYNEEDGYFVNISIDSEYSGDYSVRLDGQTITNAQFLALGSSHSIRFEDINTGNHTIHLIANSIDGQNKTISTSFQVVHSSNTIIQVLKQTTNVLLNSKNHSVVFRLWSHYPESYGVFIDEIEVFSGYFINGETISISINNYTGKVGFHNVSIVCSGRDGLIDTHGFGFSVISLEDTKGAKPTSSQLLVFTLFSLQIGAMVSVSAFSTFKKKQLKHTINLSEKTKKFK